VEVGRHHPLDELLRELDREGLAERMAVRRLDPGGTAALVAASLGGEVVPEELTALVHARTEGNPFFIQQVMRTLLEREGPQRDEGRWTRGVIEGIAVPQSIRAAVGQRLARLSGET
jgi:predicted ATPase